MYHNIMNDLRLMADTAYKFTCRWWSAYSLFRDCSQQKSVHQISLCLTSFSQFPFAGKTHYNPITYCYYFLSDNQFVASHRSHKSHKERIVTLAFAIRLQTLGKADKLRALCDAASVRFVRSVWNQIFAREEPIGHRLLRHHFRAIL